MKSLETLDLHKNWIEVIGDNTFKHLKSLIYLDLKENSLKFLAPRSFYGLTKLQRLVLQVNYSFINNCIFDIDLLQMLQDNKLLSLGSEVFKYTSNLMNLDLQQNVLETLTEDTIEPLKGNLKKETMMIFLEGKNTLQCEQGSYIYCVLIKSVLEQFLFFLSL